MGVAVGAVALSLWVHDDRFSRHDIIINRDMLRQISASAAASPSNNLTAFNENAPSNWDSHSYTIETGDLVEISATPHAKNGLVAQVVCMDHEMAAKQPQLQISIAQHLAALFELQPRSNVYVRKADKSIHTSDFIELSFKDQYIARSDMWRLKLSLLNSSIYIGKKVESLGVRASIKDIIVNGNSVRCGYITESTKTIFRSESAKYFLFIQMSREMWEFDDDGELFMEKCVHGFLPDLFASWRQRSPLSSSTHTNPATSSTGGTANQGLSINSANMNTNANSTMTSTANTSGSSNTSSTNHVVSIVLFSRVFFNDHDQPDFKNELDRDACTGRLYRDFYRVVVDWETRSDWSQVLVQLKREFFRFEKEILQRHGEGGSLILSGTNSHSSEGNILEAINLALNPFDKHYIDRDLLRTGLSIVIITPSPGLFHVDKKLCRLTTQRMIDNGISCDIVSLSKPPLHSVPLFQFVAKDHPLSDVMKGSMSGASNAEEHHSQHGTGDRKYFDSWNALAEERNDVWDPLYYDEKVSDLPDRTFFTMPSWVEISFYSRSHHEQHDSISRSNNSAQFTLRSKCYELSNMGVMDMESTILVDYLDPTPFEQYRDHMLMNSESVQQQQQQPPSLKSPYQLYDEIAFTGNMKITGRFNLSHSESGTWSGGVGQYSQPVILSGSYGGKSSHMTSALASPDSFTSKIMIDGQKVTSTTGIVRSNDGNNGTLSRKRSGSNVNKLGLESLNIHSTNSKSTEDIETSQLSPIHIRNNDRNISISRNTNFIGSSSYKETASPISHLDKSSPGKSHLHHNIRFHAFRQNYINPCNPTKNIIRPNPQTRRWQHVFTSPTATLFDPPKTNWKSLTTPACLPLTTDFFPTPEELATLYSENTYSVTPADDVLSPYQDEPPSSVSGRNNENKRVEALLVELISQRLAQGFQLVLSNAIEKVAVGPLVDESINLTGGSKFWGAGVGGVMGGGAGAGGSGNSAMNSSGFGGGVRGGGRIVNDSHKSRGASTTRISTTSPYYLSLGDHVHRLFFDALGKNVEVKRYVRKISYKKDSYMYKCCIWPKHFSSYVEADVTFSYPLLQFYNWNYLDHLISGYQEEMTDSLRFWRTRFILIPMESIPQSNSILNPSNDTLDEEELRLAGFNKFVELFERARWLQPHEQSFRHSFTTKKEQLRTRSNLNIELTTLSASAYVKEEWGKIKVTGGDVNTNDDARNGSGIFRRGSVWPGSNMSDTNFDILTKTTPFTAIAAAMQHPTYGFPIQDRRWHLRKYESSFVGSECVDWMVRCFTDIDSREDAEAFGNLLLQKGVFEHSTKRHRFLDGHYFYVISNDYRILQKEKEKSQGGKVISSLFPLRMMSKSGSTSDSQTSLIDPSASRPDPIELTRKIVIDMDPQRRSSRREMALLHYDTIHNAKNAYHIQLHWLVCTPRLIEDLLSNWSRIAEKCGLKFIEVPVEAPVPFSNDNPFQSVAKIELALPPPSYLKSQSSSPIAPGSALETHLGSFDFEDFGVPHHYFECEFLKRQGFVLDVEADKMFPEGSVTYSFKKPVYKYTQFVHKSGTVLVQILEEGKGFLWANNRLHLAGTAGRASSSNSSLSFITSPDALKLQFVEVCSNSDKLRVIWDDISTSMKRQMEIPPTVSDETPAAEEQRERVSVASNEPTKGESDGSNVSVSGYHVL